MPRRTQEDDDEAYAKALQDEYRKEFIRRQTDTSSSRSLAASGGGVDDSNKSTKMKKSSSSRNNSRKSSSRKSCSGNNNGSGDEIEATGSYPKNRRSSTGGSGGRSSSSSRNKNNSNNRRSSTGNTSTSSIDSIDSNDSALSRNSSSKRKSGRNSGVDSTGQVVYGQSARRQSIQSQSSRRIVSTTSTTSNDDWLSTHHSDTTGTGTGTGTETIVPIPPPYIVSSSSGNNGDEEYARQIQNQIEQEEMEQSKRDEEYARTIAASGGGTPRKSRSSSRRSSRRSSSPRKSSSTSSSRRSSLLLSSSPTSTSSNIVNLPIPPLASSSSTRILQHQSNSKFQTDDDRYSNASGSTAPLTDIGDEEVARRIQQEIHDADFAQRMSLREQQEIASNRVVQSIERQQEQLALAQDEQQRPPKSCLAKFLPLAFCIIVAVTIPLLFVFNVFSTDDIPFFGDLFGDDFIGNDPWSGKVNNVTIIEINGTSVPQVPSNAYRWETNNENQGRNGLRLDILNACSEDGDYSNFVQQAITNWDEGSPIDSLTLFATKIRYEKDCTTITGKLKICNGDYGDTRWRGLNEVLLSPRQNTIVASTAKLNEYYLNYENDYQKLYTCCHEIGHGFGLPHWDENFFNKDLGNCMDYTQNPEKSYKPDVSNFLYLAQLYGGREVIPGSTDSITGLSAVQDDYGVDELDYGVVPQDYGVVPQDYGADEQDKKNEKEDKNKNKNDRQLRTTLRNRFRFRGLSTSASSSLQEQDQQENQHRGAGIPLSHSRLLNEDGILPGVDDVIIGNNSRRRRKRTRILLQATEHNEIHMYESDEYPGHTVIQRFSLVVQ